MLVLAVILFVLGVGLISLARFWPTSKPKPAPAIAAVAAAPAVAEPVRAPGITGPVVAITREITWPLAIDPEAGTLTDHERRRVIEGLGIVGDAWCAQILTRAFDEEAGDLRVAVVEALSICESPAATETLERAYASHAVAERYAAIDGASRRVHIALLERALRDTDGCVALAAAYGLSCAHRTDLVDIALDGREDSRANEIRRVLPILA
jgi:hypothetical protein